MAMDRRSVEAWQSVLGCATLSPWQDRSDLALVTAEDGRTYMLKEHGPWRNGASLADEYRVQLHLHAAGLPVSVLVVTDEGRLAAGDATTSYTLSPVLPAEEIDPELADDAAGACRRVGEIIGRLHVELARYPWPVSSFRHELKQRTFGEAYPRLPRAWTGRTVEPIRAQLTAAVTGLSTQLIHGDCSPGNILLRTQRSEVVVSGLIDIDHLPVGQPIYDLGYYLGARARTAVSASAIQPDRCAVFVSRLGDYVAGYRTRNRLTSREISAVIPTMIAAEITSVEWSNQILTGQIDRDPRGHEENVSTGLQMLSWLCENFDSLNASVYSRVQT